MDTVLMHFATGYNSTVSELFLLSPMTVSKAVDINVRALGR